MSDQKAPFETWWFNEGSGPPKQGEDLEEFTKRMCAIAWANGAFKAVEQAEQLARDQIQYGTRITQDGKRIDPMSIYKGAQPVACEHKVHSVDPATGNGHYCLACFARGKMRFVVEG